MQGGWQPPPGGGGYGPPGGGGYGQPPPGAPGGAPPGYGAPPPSMGFNQNPYGAQPPAMGGMGMGGGSYGNYEFNDAENSVIDKAASKAKLWGIISTTIGALQVMGSCGAIGQPTLATWLPQGIVAIVVGVTFIGVGNSLKAVVQTQGNDIMHMMQALQKMTTAFTIEIICAIIGFVLMVLGFILFAFILVAAVASS